MGRAYEVRKASIQKTGAIKAKIYSNFAKEIYLAAKSGIPDIDSNIGLKRWIEKAKRAQVPNDIIERAIDKAKGSGGSAYETHYYEGFGPGTSTLVIKCLTDNVNRTVSFVRGAFNKINKSLGVANSVSYNYDHLAVISIKSNEEEKIFNTIIEADIEIIDIENEQGFITITASPNDYHVLKDILEKTISNIQYEIDEIGMYPKTMVELSPTDLELFYKLIRTLDEIDDVSEIYHNVEIS